MIPLAAADVREILGDRVYTPANLEKQGALAHFQPDAVLITEDGELRDRRRRFNEQVLEPGHPHHSLAARFAAVVEEEIGTLPHDGVMTWADFHPVHWRIVRRLVLGDAARDDERLTALLNTLRADANWFYLRRRRTRLLEDFRRRLGAHLRRAEPGSLAEIVAATPSELGVRPAGQVPHWLFAFDAAGIAAYRALALAEGHTDDLRAVMEESLRLWPTTLVILRDTTRATQWRGQTVPENTIVAIYSPYANRDPHAIDRPDAFVPGRQGWAGVPFSAGFAACPARDVVLQTAELVMGAVLRTRRLEASIELAEPLPGTIDHFALRYAVHPL